MLLLLIPLEKPSSSNLFNRFFTAANAELFQHFVHLIFKRAFCFKQLLLDLRLRITCFDELEHFAFSDLLIPLAAPRASAVPAP